MEVEGYRVLTSSTLTETASMFNPLPAEPILRAAELFGYHDHICSLLLDNWIYVYDREFRPNFPATGVSPGHGRIVLY